MLVAILTSKKSAPLRQSCASLWFPYGNQLLQLQHESKDLSKVEDIFAVESEALPGYNINIISNLRLNEHLDLRFTPGFAATVRRLHFDLISPFTGERVITTRQVESSYVQFPLHLKFKSVRIDNYRLF